MTGTATSPTTSTSNASNASNNSTTTTTTTNTDKPPKKPRRSSLSALTRLSHSVRSLFTPRRTSSSSSGTSIDSTSTSTTADPPLQRRLVRRSSSTRRHHRRPSRIRVLPPAPTPTPVTALESASRIDSALSLSISFDGSSEESSTESLSAPAFPSNPRWSQSFTFETDGTVKSSEATSVLDLTVSPALAPIRLLAPRPIPPTPSPTLLSAVMPQPPTVLDSLNRRADNLKLSAGTSPANIVGYCERLYDKYTRANANCNDQDEFVFGLAFVDVMLRTPLAGKDVSADVAKRHKALKAHALAIFDRLEALKPRFNTPLTMAATTSAVAPAIPPAATTAAAPRNGSSNGFVAPSLVPAPPVMPSSPVRDYRRPVGPDSSTASSHYFPTSSSSAAPSSATSPVPTSPSPRIVRPPQRSSSVSDHTSPLLGLDRILDSVPPAAADPVIRRVPSSGSTLNKFAGMEDGAVAYFRNAQEKISGKPTGAPRTRITAAERSARVQSIVNPAMWDMGGSMVDFEQFMREPTPAPYEEFDVFGNRRGRVNGSSSSSSSSSRTAPPISEPPRQYTASPAPTLTTASTAARFPPAALARIDTTVPPASSGSGVHQSHEHMVGSGLLSPRTTSLPSPTAAATSATSNGILSKLPLQPPALAPKPNDLFGRTSATGRQGQLRARPNMGSAPALPGTPRSGGGSMSAVSPMSAGFATTAAAEFRWHDSRASMSQVVDAGIAGLKNLGNSCYQNSVMQCLFGAVPLVRFFMGGEFRNHINRDNPMGHGGKVAQSFFKLVLDMKRNAGSSVAPVSFRDMLGDVAPHYATRDQHDSQEFLTFLLDSLHEDLKRPLDPGARLPPSDNDDLESIPDVAEAARIAWARYMVRNSSVISQIFQGQLRSELQCSTCGTRSVSYSTFSTLSVPVPGGARARAPVHLEDCLREFVRPQVLDGDNAWRCPRCKVARSAIKSMAITKFPSVLIVHLMRFSFDGPFRNKIDRLVEFPIRGLALQPTGRPTAAKYDLFAAGNHYGGLDGGHYTAIVRHGSDWHYFDDSRVSKCSESEIVTNAAYTLFYVCRGSPEAQVLGVESGHKL